MIFKLQRFITAKVDDLEENKKYFSKFLGFRVRCIQMKQPEDDENDSLYEEDSVDSITNEEKLKAKQKYNFFYLPLFYSYTNLI